jgi:hypothetical protein
MRPGFVAEGNRLVLARLHRLLAWLAADADEMWRGAPLAHVYAENQRRHQTGSRLIERKL